jgi:CBS domain-containing protein
MKVESILRAKGRQVTTIQPWATVTEAVARLDGPPQIGALVVTGVAHGFTGIIRERDVVRSLGRYGPGALDMRVSEIMSRRVPTCAPTDSVVLVMSLMTRTRHRHVPVLEGDELVGLVSIGDLVRGRVNEMELEIGVLRDMHAARL